MSGRKRNQSKKAKTWKSGQRHRISSFPTETTNTKPSSEAPVTSENVFLDADVAYLLGMMVVRGTIHIEGDITRVLINFPYRNLSAQGLEGTELRFDQDTSIRLSLDSVRKRLTQMLEVNVDIESRENEVTLKAVFTKNTIAIRNLKRLFNGKLCYHEFEIHPAIFDAPPDVQKEFVRGIADTCASPSPSDNYMNVAHRIVLQVQFGNWKLPLQICRLLQTKLDVPVHNILWGHPNLRAPSGGH